jgi:hypothetical protein
MKMEDGNLIYKIYLPSSILTTIFYFQTIIYHPSTIIKKKKRGLNARAREERDLRKKRKN